MLISFNEELSTSRDMEARRLQLFAGLFLVDLFLIASSFILAGGIYRGEWPLPFAVSMAFAFVPIFAVIAFYQRCYSLDALDDLRYSIARLATALTISAILCMVMIFYAKAAEAFSRVMLSLALIIGFSLMASVRWLLHRILRKTYGASMSSILVINDGGPEVKLPGAFYVSASEFDLHNAHFDPDSLDQVGRLVRGVDRVIVSCGLERRVAWARILRSAGVRGDVVSEALRDLGAIALKREGVNSFLVVSTGPLGLRARAIKRLMDLVLTVPALILLSPLMLVVALLIKMEDGGPVFFVQRRMGHGNIMFDMIKFRSMRIDSLDDKGDRSTSRTDDRVTRIGRFIRKTSIDELPQLINVLRSEMSIVGPRPHALGSRAAEKHFWEIDDNYWQRHSLKPGLTGLAQVRGHRGATEEEIHLVDRLDADLEYIRTWSVTQDIKIMLMTIKVLVHPNAY